jgi:cell shape-determining protein MreC
MKISRRNKFILFFAALFFVAVLNESTRHFIAGSGTAAFRPFLAFGNSIKNWIENNSYLLKEKEVLLKENLNLKEKVKEMEIKSLTYEAPGKDPEKKDFLYSHILSRPPQSPYDVLIIDAGSEDGIKNGMQVVAYGDILIGYVAEVFQKSGKIKLISFPNEETNAFLFSLNTPVIVAGRGDGNFGIKIPKSIEVNVGEKVVTLGENPFLLGIIDRIEIQSSDPFQNLYFRFPFNLQELKSVAVKK